MRDGSLILVEHGHVSITECISSSGSSLLITGSNELLLLVALFLFLLVVENQRGFEAVRDIAFGLREIILNDRRLMQFFLPLEIDLCLLPVAGDDAESSLQHLLF